MGTQTPRGMLEQKWKQSEQETRETWGLNNERMINYTIKLGATRYLHGPQVGFGYCTYRAVVPYLLFLCILGRGKTGDPSPVGRELSGRLYRETKAQIGS